MPSLYFESDTRYYRVTLEKDMLDYWVVVCSYGGKYNNLGNIKKYPFVALCDAINKFKAISKTRLKRNYMRTNPT